MAKYSVSYTNSRGVVSTCITHNLAKATLNTLPHGVEKFDGRMASVTVGLVRREDGTLVLGITNPGEPIRICFEGERIYGPTRPEDGLGFGPND